jgi:hypothetical protein
MPNPLQVKDDFNRASVKLLLTDADVALTFVGLAETTGDESHRKQAVQDARRAYHDIVRKRPQFSLANWEAHTLDLKLEQIRTRIKRLGSPADEEG